MTERRRRKLDELLPGMQLAIFEIIWFAFPWMQSIWIKESNTQLQFFVQAAGAPGEKEWEDCQRLVKEMVDVAVPNADHTIRYGSTVPQAEGYLELMSDGLFKRIAKEVAPWRLDIAR